MISIGLRVDIDTLNGTRAGLPRLLDTMGRFGIRASFFFSVGPDNMGRHIWRLFRRDFLIKMLKSRAPSLYGWGILLRGTLWPGPLIWKVLQPHLRRAKVEGHEIGLHAWDHHRWQSRAGRMSVEEVAGELGRGMAALSEIAGNPPESFAAPGWKCTDALLRAEQSLGLRYASDCRGSTIFYPVVDGRRLCVPQVPVTLPTYDEVLGRKGITDKNYNDYILSIVKEDRLNVLTIHAEVEGMMRRELFEEFIRKALTSGITIVPLCFLLPGDLSAIPSGAIGRGSIPGREGWVAVQVQGRVADSVPTAV
ncbi:MAG: polysaccharide deacetylase family protein [Candidatus Tritonobacter lacicola]|nr:polysaccharide deacetylase family protein [Candidatus Tritonobacter lacicola]